MKKIIHRSFRDQFKYCHDNDPNSHYCPVCKRTFCVIKTGHCSSKKCYGERKLLK